MKKVQIMLAAFGLAITTVLVAPPAYAVESNACHVWLGINHPINIQRANDEGGAIIGLNPGQCTSQIWGAGSDAQRFQVVSGKKIKLLYPNTATSYRAFTVPGWYRLADWCLYNNGQCYMEIVNN